MSKKRWIAGALIAVMTAALAPGAGMRRTAEVKAADAAPAAAASTPDITLESKGDEAPVYQAGQTKKWTFVVKNNSADSHDVKKNVVITVRPGENADSWPFKLSYQKYKVKIDELPVSQEGKEISFDFTQREEMPTGISTLEFSISADGVDTNVEKFYVNTTARPQEVKDNNTSSGAKDSGEGDAMPMDIGGVSNGDAAYSGGGSEGSGSVPRVIVTGFSTDPAEVRAGSDFILTIHLKNTSKSTKVQNMLFDLTAPTSGTDEQTIAPAFLPTSGSSSVYLEGIKANGTADISIQLNAKSDLLQKPYSIDLSMKYEDADSNQIEAASSISIPIKQDARFELSEFEINPEEITVGEEANVMFNLYNLGRIKLYNVKAIFEGDCIQKEEVFVGNVDSGTSASIDAMLEGKKETEGPGKVTVTLRYEDEAGKASETTSELELQVMGEMAADDVMMGEMVEETKGFPILPAVLVLAAAAVIAVIIVIVKKKKKTKIQNEEEALLDELDRPSEDEQY